MLIKSMATRKRTATPDPLNDSQMMTQNKGRSNSTTTKSKIRNQLTSSKTQASCLKKYFVKLVDFKDAVGYIKPQQIMDLESGCGLIQPVIDLENVQGKVNKILKQFIESMESG